MKVLVCCAVLKRPDAIDMFSLDVETNSALAHNQRLNDGRSVRITNLLSMRPTCSWPPSEKTASRTLNIHILQYGDPQHGDVIVQDIAVAGSYGLRSGESSCILESLRDPAYTSMF